MHYIIDALSPFFINKILRPGQVVNWSKVPFSLIERNGLLPLITTDQISKRFESYAQRIGSIGYNALSIDDLAHMAGYPEYSSGMQQKLNSYRILYEQIFASAERYKLDVFINTDASFSPIRVSENYRHVINRVVIICCDLFTKYPTVKGVIFRIGECDGVDVRCDVSSTLSFRTVKQTRELLLALLPVFKSYNKLLVFRTWTVGAFEIGDLMWNTTTYDKLFSGLSYDNLIISHKYGDTDFFKYLKLNSLIFRGEHKKIVEFQTRREYEGFGEFPSFTGYDYEHYARQLEKYPLFMGIHVWCQTGGWSKFHNCTYMPNSSLWNEINTETTLDIFKRRVSAEDAINVLCQRRFSGTPTDKLIHLLKLSDHVIKKFWYIPEFANNVLYFRRLRIPPILWIFWDTIIIHPIVRRLIQKYAIDKNTMIDDATELLSCINTMKSLAMELGIPSKSFDFQYETFKVLLLIKEYYLGNLNDEFNNNLQNTIVNYNEQFSEGLCVTMTDVCNKNQKKIIDFCFNLIIRNRPEYRFMEKAFFTVLLIPIKPILKYLTKTKIPPIASERAMGIETLLK